MKNLKDILLKRNPRKVFPSETAHCAEIIRDIVYLRVEDKIALVVDDQVFYQIVQQLNNEKC